MTNLLLPLILHCSSHFSLPLTQCNMFAASSWSTWLVCHFLSCAASSNTTLCHFLSFCTSSHLMWLICCFQTFATSSHLTILVCCFLLLATSSHSVWPFAISFHLLLSLAQCNSFAAFSCLPLPFIQCNYFPWGDCECTMEKWLLMSTYFVGTTSMTILHQQKLAHKDFSTFSVDCSRNSTKTGLSYGHNKLNCTSYKF